MQLRLLSLVTNNSGSRNRSGGLSVSLTSPDGYVIGGRAGGMLIAASPVQVTPIPLLVFMVMPSNSLQKFLDDKIMSKCALGGCIFNFKSKN